MALALSSSFEVIDPRFSKLAFGNVHVEKLWTGCRWAEGPAWFAAGRYLVWSDIPNDRMLRWDETDGSVSVFRQPAMNTNGHTVDLQGRLVSCEHRGRCVSRTEHDGSRTVLAVACRRQALQFTERRGREVRRQHLVHRPELRHRQRLRRRCGAQRDRRPARLPHRPGQRRGDGGRQRLRAAQRARVLARRIAALHRRHRRDAPRRRAAPCAALPRRRRRQARRRRGVRDLRRSACTTACASTCTATCGCRPATACTAMRADGTLLGKVLVPEVVANLCFGGAKRNRMFICGTTSLYSVYLNTRGAHR